MRYCRFFFVFVIGFFILNNAFSQTSIKNLNYDELNSFIDEIMKEWKVPGLSVAVVKNDSVVLLKGYGYRDVKNKLKVTPSTLFGIASCSKSFTTAGLGILVDREKLTFSKLVKDIIPEFKLSDEFATKHIMVRDLVTHQSGLARHDRLWYMSPFSRNDLLYRMRYLDMNKDLHQSYQYNNLMYVAAGVVIEKCSNQTWEDFTRENILTPIGMNKTNFSIIDMQKSDDYALPYGEFKGKVDIIPFCNLDAAGPCGSINSNAEEMAKWVTMQMNKGNYKGKQIVSEKSLKEIHSPQMISSKSIDNDELYYSLYGMGWGINQYRSNLMISHSGSIDGYASLVTFLPKEKLGIVILTNLEGSLIHRTIAYYIYDKYFGLEPVKWNERARETEKKNKEDEIAGQKKMDSLRVKNTKPSHDLTAYTGEYENDGYGKITIKLENGKLRLYYNNYFYEMEHYHYDVFIAEKEDWEDKKKIKFEMNKDGVINVVYIPFETSVKDIIFTRVK